MNEPTSRQDRNDRLAEWPGSTATANCRRRKRPNWSDASATTRKGWNRSCSTWLSMPNSSGHRAEPSHEGDFQGKPETAIQRPAWPIAQPQRADRLPRHSTSSIRAGLSASPGPFFLFQRRGLFLSGGRVAFGFGHLRSLGVETARQSGNRFAGPRRGPHQRGRRAGGGNHSHARLPLDQAGQRPPGGRPRLPGRQVRPRVGHSGDYLQDRRGSHPPGTGDVRGGLGERRLSAGRQIDREGPALGRGNTQKGAATGGPRPPNGSAVAPPQLARPPAFVIRTPTALVSGAAVEVGLDVQPETCRVHVFQGSATLRLVRGGQPPSPPIPLAADFSASVGTAGVKPCTVVTPGAAEPMFFARRTGRPVASLPSGDDEMMAGAWLKSIDAEGQQRRLAAVGSGRDYVPPASATPESRAGDVPGPRSPTGTPACRRRRRVHDSLPVRRSRLRALHDGRWVPSAR